jgi:2-iminobutanoate/2-iminopropanoate deaminase
MSTSPTAPRTAIETKAAPGAIGPYSQAIRCGNLVFTSGQIPIDPLTGDIPSHDIEQQAEQVMSNLQNVLDAAGSSLENTLKITCFITNMSDFPTVNSVFERFLKKPYPARSCVEVSALPKGVAIEVEAVAAIG